MLTDAPHSHLMHYIILVHIATILLRRVQAMEGWNAAPKKGKKGKKH